MPVSTPKRIADPAVLERYDSPCIIRSSAGLSCTYTNVTGTTILQGEPVFIGGRLGLAQSVILPGEQGTVVFDWIADVRLDPAHSGDILQNASVWWSYGVTTVAAGVGGGVASAPTNGFLMGYAVPVPGDTRVNGSAKQICATTGDTFVRVMARPDAHAAIGTVPTFN